jgi:glycosyltransferase involved in cell wall biosynthesis
VVGAAVGGIPEVITDGVTGVLAERENVKALGEATLSLLRAPQEARQMGQRLRELVATRHSVVGMQDETMAIYFG